MAKTLRQLTLVQRSFVASSENLGRRVVNGATFTFLGIAIRTGITVASMAILARLLTPADFGHIAMATVVTELAALFSNFGFGSILVQRSRVSRIQMDTMFWAALGLGVLLTGVVFGTSLVAAEIFNDELVGALLQVLCLSFIFEELTVVPRSLMARMMMFREDFWVQVWTLIIRTVTAVLIAGYGYGVWSLVFGGLVGVVFQALAYAYFIRYRPRFRFSKVFLTSTWRTNGGYFGNGILFYLNSNLDLFLVGRLLGATSLGYYQNARSLTDEVRVRMVQPLQRVLFPAFSAIQNEHERFRAGILRSGRLLAVVFMPVGFGMAAVAQELVPLLYGAQWLAMIPILQVISIGSGFSAAGSIATPIFNATDRVGLSFKWHFLMTAIATLTTLGGAYWGVLGVAYSKLLMALVWLLFLRLSFSLVDLRWRHLWSIVGTPFIISLLMWGVIEAARDPVYEAVSGLSGRFACLVAVGAVVYIIGALIVCRDHVRDATMAVSKFRN
jgi:PST family polysaccharide transporter